MAKKLQAASLVENSAIDMLYIVSCTICCFYFALI